MSFFEYFSNFSSTGTLFSSSIFLAKKKLLIFDFLPDKDHYNILEIGPATGALTNPLLKYLQDNNKKYNLDLIELNLNFCKDLTQKYDKDKSVKIFNKSILDFNQNNYSYDLIISSLPFNSFSPEFNNKVLTKISSLSNEETVLSFYEYLVLTEMKRYSSRLHDCWYKKISKKVFYEQIEWKNIPPARIRFMKSN